MGPKKRLYEFGGRSRDDSDIEVAPTVRLKCICMTRMVGLTYTLIVSARYEDQVDSS